MNGKRPKLSARWYTGRISHIKQHIARLPMAEHHSPKAGLVSPLEAPR